MVGRNSNSETGNFLEMVNLAISVLDCDYVDRSLDTTGEFCFTRKLSLASSNFFLREFYDYCVGWKCSIQCESRVIAYHRS